MSYAVQAMAGHTVVDRPPGQCGPEQEHSEEELECIR
jgi:hypothetical protein